MKKLLFLFLFIPFFTQAQVIVTAVGTGTATGLGDGGSGIAAHLLAPYGVTLDDSGNLYICDGGNERIRKVSPAYGGIITTIAGNGAAGYSGDGGLGIYAQIAGVIDIAIDRHGNVYLADGGMGANCIRKITPGDTITTIAGTGVAGYNGDGIAAITAQLNSPKGIAVDSIGNLYIADDLNYRIRKIDTAGIITTVAGTGISGFSPDGSRADTSALNHAFTIRIDRNGNLFFADNVRIRKIDTTGIITTIAGNGTIGYSGDGGLATAVDIGGEVIALDNAGNLFIADQEANRIRKVDATGIINTIAGNGFSGYSGDGGDPLLAELAGPQGVAVSDSGDVYIGDVGNSRVRLITKHPLGVNSIISEEQGIKVFPNPSDGVFELLITTSTKEQATVTINNVFGQQVQVVSVETNKPAAIQLHASAGIYYLAAATTEKIFYQKIIVQ